MKENQVSPSLLVIAKFSELCYVFLWYELVFSFVSIAVENAHLIKFLPFFTFSC